MKILALEFSSPIRGVAVAVDGKMCGQAAEQSGRETHAFALIDSALQCAGVSRHEIECIVVGLGPGSYAGIRIAIAIAQGWQLASGIKLLGISSAEVVAAQAGLSGTMDVRVALDAQRNELYAARYHVSVPERPKLIEAFRLLSGAERLECEGRRGLFRMDLPPEAPTSAGVALPPDATLLAWLATVRSDFLPGHDLEPIYARKAEFVKAQPPKFGGM
jgi:tRNA threonylcarbamoyladenosine biosynthesis protein TsaB